MPHGGMPKRHGIFNRASIKKVCCTPIFIPRDWRSAPVDHATLGSILEENNEARTMLKQIAKLIKANRPSEVVYAHCDGPCGVYDPSSIRIAAEAVVSMTKKIGALEVPDASDAKAVAAYQNTVSRYVAIKEEQAHLAKSEILVLWTDYFKPVHLGAVPRLARHLLESS